MAIDFMEFIKETFDNIEELDPDKLQVLATETMAYLESLGDVINSGDQAARTEALNAALEIKDFLQAKAKSVTQSAGVSEQEFRDLAKNPAFNDAEKDAIVNISDNLDFKKDNKTKIKKLKPIPLS